MENKISNNIFLYSAVEKNMIKVILCAVHVMFIDLMERKWFSLKVVNIGSTIQVLYFYHHPCQKCRSIEMYAQYKRKNKEITLCRHTLFDVYSTTELRINSSIIIIKNTCLFGTYMKSIPFIWLYILRVKL